MYAYSYEVLYALGSIEQIRRELLSRVGDRRAGSIRWGLPPEGQPFSHEETWAYIVMMFENDEAIREAVARRAYHLSQQRANHESDAAADWYRAEAEVIVDPIASMLEAESRRRREMDIRSWGE